MLRKTFSGLILIVFLTGILTSTINIQPVKASGTIYIRSDGGIDPPTAPITTADNVTYTFTGNINGSIVVERNSIIINGADYALQGTGTGWGIYLSYRSNVTIKNTNIKNFLYGVYLTSSSTNVVSGNNITNNNGDGVYLYYSSNNTILGNSITNNGAGVDLGSSSNNTVYGNNITN
ncbi:right-handed parallel beta-helix repeat-containing protein, partial [Candidatus Bathyarchaeota archaeon]|nr:right-handed parallel beta-helix repeat-containing protein [Candidatus Bathyarchaeota archaeon]